MNRRLAALTLAAGLALPVAVAAPAGAVAHGTCPPENVLTKVYQPSGPPLWVDWIGSGCGGDSPMRDSIRTLTADGFYLVARPRGTCGQTRALACVVIGP